MRIFLRKFKLFLLNENYSLHDIKRSLRHASIFLCWYHGELEKLTMDHYENFLRILYRKQYSNKQIKEYQRVLKHLYTLLYKKTIIKQKKLHHKDEVFNISRCTNSNKKRQSMAGMVN